MRVATWNVNSIRRRQEIVLDWLERQPVDVLLLQETKVKDDEFPRMLFEAAGWSLALHGQQGGRNGVAILARHEISDVVTGLGGEGPDGKPDEQARWIEGTVGRARLVSVYVPNGTALDSPNFPYKLAFLERLAARAERLRREFQRVVIGGDYNVAPFGLDVHDPEGIDGRICFHPEERRRLRALLHSGYADAYREVHPTSRAFSWWDLRAGRFDRDEGLRIDHLLLSPPATDALLDAGMDRDERRGQGVSDHVPVWAEMN